MKLTYRLSVVLCLVFVTQILFAQPIPPTPFNLVAQFDDRSPWLTRFPGVDLTWEMPGPTMMGLFFKVYRSADDTASFKLLNVTNRIGYRDELVLQGHTYFYRVTSVLLNATTVIIESKPSNIAEATIVPPTARPHGTISGTVIDSVTGKPIPMVKILFFPLSLKPIARLPQVWTDTAGQYKAVLDTGTYIIEAQPVGLMAMGGMSIIPLYRPQWYKDSPDPKHATPVVVTDGSEFSADFALTKFVMPTFVSISGTVTDTAGQPIRKATVVITRTIQDMTHLAATSGEIPGMGMESMDIDGLGHMRGVLWTGLTDSSGNYQARVLADNDYVAMASKRGYVPEFYNNKTNPTDADIIHLVHDTTGINFSLSPVPVLQNGISGTVRDSNGVRVPSRIVLLPIQVSPRPSAARFATTDSTGAYTITNVRAGKYFVLALPFSNYAPAFYKAGAYGVLRWQKADTVTVPSSGNVTGIDIGVVPIESFGFTRLAGNIGTGSGAAGSPIEGVNVVIQDAQGTVVGYGISDATGAYAVDALPSGQLTAAIDRPGYESTQAEITVGTSDYALSHDFTMVPLNPTSVPAGPVVPLSYSLEQNYPNPFNPSTQISFSLPVLSNVTLRVYNLLGQEIATLINNAVPAGAHVAVWNGKDSAGRSVASGVYFYRLQASPVIGGEPFGSMKRMVLVK